MVKLFLVEDNPQLRVFIKGELGRLQGVDIVGDAFDESGALAWLQANPGGAEIVVVDLFLQDGTGFGVLREAKRLAPSAMVVVLTNSTTPLIRSQCLRLGAQAVFDKLEEFDQFVVFVAGNAPVR